jgi:uncharacterized protein
VVASAAGPTALPASATTGSGPAAAAASGATEAQTAATQTATINVRSNGYDPQVVQIKAGVPTKLNVVSDNVQSCARAFVIPALNLERVLPANGTETIDLPASPPGEIAFSCSMGMFTGVIQVVQ